MNDLMENQIDYSTASLEELENIDVTDLLGQDISDVELSSSLPDGTFIGLIEGWEKKVFAAKPEQGKAGSIALNMKIKVHNAVHISDANVDPNSVKNRYHFETFFISSDGGVAQLVKFLLGIMGISFKDKDAIKSIGQSIIALLEQLKSGNVYFGFTVQTKESNGYENTRMILKEDKFINMEKAQEQIMQAA